MYLYTSVTTFKLTFNLESFERSKSFISAQLEVPSEALDNSVKSDTRPKNVTLHTTYKIKLDALKQLTKKSNCACTIEGCSKATQPASCRSSVWPDGKLFPCASLNLPPPPQIAWFARHTVAFCQIYPPLSLRCLTFIFQKHLCPSLILSFHPALHFVQ